MEKIKQIFQNLKEYFNPSTLHTSQKPMVMACYLFGIIPFYLVTDERNDRYECSFNGLIIATIHIMVFGACIVLTFSRQQHFVSAFFQTDISQVTSIIQLIISFLALAIVYPNIYIRKQKILKIFDILSKMDGQFMWSDNKTEHKKTFWYSVKLILANFVIYFIYIFGSYAIQINLDRPAQVYAWVSFFLPHFVLSFVTLKFLCIMQLLRNRIRSLNRVSTFVLKLYFSFVLLKLM